MLDESHVKVIVEWEHYAAITLFDIDGFKASADVISERLGITKNHTSLRTTEDISSQALKDSHIETLEKGKNKLEDIAVELRDFSAMTIAMDLERMPEVKTIIREFVF